MFLLPVLIIEEGSSIIAFFFKIFFQLIGIANFASTQN